MTIFQDFQGPRRDIGMARPRRDRDTQKRVSRHPALPVTRLFQTDLPELWWYLMI